MAQLKDTTISGSLRVTDNIYSIINQFKILQAPTESNGSTYGAGTNGQILLSNGTSVYWGNISNLTGTLGVAHGGTGATSFTANSVIMSGSSTTDALTTRAIYNRTTAGNIEWTNASSDGLYLLTKNALAYWNGAYSGSSSNLTTLGASVTAKNSFTVNNVNGSATIIAASNNTTPVIKAVDSGITNTDAHIAITICNTSGRMGLWTSGYYTAADRSSFTGDGQWVIYRDVNGKVVIPSMTSTTGVVQIASGGTGSSSVTGAKASLGLGSSEQNFQVANYTGNDQHWGIRAIVVNNNNQYAGRRNALILTDSGLLAYSSLPSDTSINNTIWALYATAEGQIRFRVYTPPTDIDTNSATERLFVKFAHAPYNVGTIGSSTQPIYMTQTGELAACNFKIIYNASTPTGTISEGTIWLQPIS